MSSNDMEFELRWLSAQLDRLLQSGNLRPAPSALHNLGGVWGLYHTHQPPQLVNMGALNSMVDSAPVSYSYLSVTLDNTPVWLYEVEA